MQEIWLTMYGKGASLPKGFKLGVGGPGQVRFTDVPAFMTKSMADKITQKTISDPASANLEELSGIAKPVSYKNF